jgi:hypothetical protein
MRMMLRGLIALALVAAGVGLGRAQGRSGDFEIRIEAPQGFTTLECVRGCTIVGARDVAVREPKATYRFGCSTPNESVLCRATVHGFIVR